MTFRRSFLVLNYDIAPLTKLYGCGQQKKR